MCPEGNDTIGQVAVYTYVAVVAGAVKADWVRDYALQELNLKFRSFQIISGMF